MRSDEMFDSKPNVAQFGFHRALVNAHVPSPNVEQKSIEMHCLVLYGQYK